MDCSHTLSRWQPQVRVAYDYYPFGLTWHNPAAADTPEGRHDHAYQDKEFQWNEFGAGAGMALYDFHARMYDPATATWSVPDPAEQFSNPYLAMGNNPVVGVDPDGRFVVTAIVVGAVLGGYMGGVMANDHGNPMRWDPDNPNTWIGIGAGMVIGALGGFSLAASKGGATILGKTMAEAAGKKFFGSTMAGMMNSISNYDGADSFGWGTLGDFASGFGGAYVGLKTGSVSAAFNAGGFFNSVNNTIQDGFGDYPVTQLIQNWIGGGLSSIVGMGYGIPKGPAPVGQSAVLKKFGKSFLKYSTQSAMWDIAHTSREDLAKRNLGDFVTLYALGGAMGASAEMLGLMKPNLATGEQGLLTTKVFKSSLYAALALMEIGMTGQLKGKAGYPKPQPNKGGVLGVKWWFTSLSYFQ